MKYSPIGTAINATRLSGESNASATAMLFPAAGCAAVSVSAVCCACAEHLEKWKMCCYDADRWNSDTYSHDGAQGRSAPLARFRAILITHCESAAPIQAWS